MRKFIEFISLCLASIILFASCASSTMINTKPAGAKVFINGEAVGETPYLYTDTKISFSLVNVDLIKDGYEPIYTSFRRSEEFNVGNFIGGCIVWPILIWTMDYKPSHTYELVPSAALNNQESTIVTQDNQAPTSKVQKLKDLKQKF